MYIAQHLSYCFWTGVMRRTSLFPDTTKFQTSQSKSKKLIIAITSQLLKFVNFNTLMLIVEHIPDIA